MIRQASAADPLRIAVLVSGSGTNLQALIDAFGPASEVRIVGVASSRHGVRALERAATAGIESAVFERGDDGAGRDRRLAAWLSERSVELVVLAGYMGLVTAAILDRVPAINVHPSLLPAFAGAHAIDDALAAGVRITGVTVHLVDATYDTGSILLQAALDVHYDETADAVRARLHELEHRLLPEAVRYLAADRITISEGRARIA